MDQTTVKHYRSWFARFVRDHAAGSEQDQRNILVKAKHTEEVCANSVRIAAELGLGPHAAALAETIALFHDVGRFPQYLRYRTFEDSRSVNHAILGAKVLVEGHVLGDLPGRERDVIVRAVTLHNVFSLPPLLSDEVRMHAQIVRDADKLDIWRIFTGLLEQDRSEWPSAVSLGLPDGPGCSREILDALMRREMVTLASLRNLNDFKLLQLAWIYDLNFAPSLAMVLERRVIDRLSASLAGDDRITRVLEDLREHVRRRLDAP
ncbi:MAG: HD domain-containing protein [Nitrospirota bacterium]